MRGAGRLQGFLFGALTPTAVHLTAEGELLPLMLLAASPSGSVAYRRRDDEEEYDYDEDNDYELEDEYEPEDYVERPRPRRPPRPLYRRHQSRSERGSLMSRARAYQRRASVARDDDRRSTRSQRKTPNTPVRYHRPSEQVSEATLRTAETASNSAVSNSSQWSFAGFLHRTLVLFAVVETAILGLVFWWFMREKRKRLHTEPLWKRASEAAEWDEAQGGKRTPLMTADEVLRGLLLQESLNAAQKEDIQFVARTLDAYRAVENLAVSEFGDLPEMSESTREWLRIFGGIGHGEKSVKNFRLSVRAINEFNIQERRRRSRHSTVNTVVSVRSSIADIEGLTMEVATNQDVLAELEKVDSWNEFNTLRMGDLAKNHSLKLVALAVMQQRNLLQTFAIEAEPLQSFLSEIEKQYRRNPYHNALHAADVTQSLHVLLQGKAQGILTSIEILSAIFAAVCHDVGHPGVTNQFRIVGRDEAALTYNDQSVNENMHCAIAYRTLARPGCNFLRSLDRESEATVRRIMIAMVLATDMARHFKDLKKFEELVRVNGPDVQAWESNLPALEMILHGADICSSTTKPLAASLVWTERVLTEFFAQGDRERDLGRSISALCDRRSVNVAESQISYVNFIVKPCFTALRSICDLGCPEGLENLAEYVAYQSAELARDKAPDASAEPSAIAPARNSRQRTSTGNAPRGVLWLTPPSRDSEMHEVLDRSMSPSSVSRDSSASPRGDGRSDEPAQNRSAGPRRSILKESRAADP